MKRKLSLLMTVLLLALTLAAAVLPAYAAEGCVTVEVLDAAIYRTDGRAMLDMVNEFRTGSDAWFWNVDNSTKTSYVKQDGTSSLSALKYDYLLEQTAIQRAVEIALSWGHTRPNGESCFTAYPTGYGAKAENIAIGQRSLTDVMNAWIEADKPYSGQGHRRNMLGANYTHMAIAHVVVNGIHGWVQEFTRRSGDPAQTEALDEVKNVPVEVMLSQFRTASLTLQAAGTTLEVGGRSALPEAGTKLRLSTTWSYVSDLSIATDVQWTVTAGSDVVAVEDGEIVALKKGTATLQAAVFSGTDWERTAEYTVTVGSSIAGATVSTAEKSYVHTGAAITPNVTVKVDSATLIQNVDYTVDYTNNTEVGTATVTVTGIGAYSGSASGNFTITHDKQLRFHAAQPAGCETEGSKAYYACSCGRLFANADATGAYSNAQAVVIPAKGHTEIMDPEIPASCTSSGLTAGSHCAACGITLTGRYYLAPLDHSFVNGVCTRCGYAQPVNSIPMHRLYNPYTLEHMYCSNESERSFLLSLGWTYDGIAFNTPSTGYPVYRLYNPYGDWHTYSADANEIAFMESQGWSVDGIMCSSTGADGLPVYRLYNPYESINYLLFTSGEEEKDWLVSLGWEYQGIAWYVLRN